jgi:uncharacterized membrane protein
LEREQAPANSVQSTGKNQPTASPVGKQLGQVAERRSKGKIAMAKLALKIALGVLFILSGGAHFVFPKLYLKIIPPFLPWPLFLVYLSGLCEMVLGVAIFTRFARRAAWGLVALLVAVFPANVQMALHPELTPNLPAWTLWARLPLQAVLIAWAYWFTA